ncbi:MAG TPA: NAD-dependent epimerase/dehydratase family protein [Chthonomonas sp.]|uniref:NAD-dependent epimerase/dehydratase family protein n=1 Tax=Chthonomonas sp. TaxID=2282153 RepID=UPI002B4AD329|nr:NAD-dependent epimerase/dehydratase family protein [Chthonomonas sp.]HLI48498.1 NAD-dependent epimerase/dehydratase family protein [Chthonomonas sp.]
MKILIIGGTGLISTPITHLLAQRGEEVWLYNRGKTERPVPANVRTIHGDRTQLATFEAQMKELGPLDCVIDMVGYHPEEAECAIRVFSGRVGQYIFCSTVDVYTKPAPSYPVREEAPRNPSSEFSYAYNKAIMENLFLQAHERGDLCVTILRPAATYHDRGTVLYSLGAGSAHLDRLRKAKPIIVHGDGTSLWCYCHAEDVARAFVNAVGNPKAFGSAYNVAGEEVMTWKQHHERAAEAIGAPPPTFVAIPTHLLVQLSPKRAWITKVNFSYNNIFDNSPAQADLGFRYTISFTEGVQRMAAWYEANGGFENSDADTEYETVLQRWRRLESLLEKEAL